VTYRGKKTVYFGTEMVSLNNYFLGIPNFVFHLKKVIEMNYWISEFRFGKNTPFKVTI